MSIEDRPRNDASQADALHLCNGTQSRNMRAVAEKQKEEAKVCLPACQ